MKGFVLATAVAAATTAALGRAQTVPMARISREYGRLVLAMGHHDQDYVDAYYGPADIKAEADAAKLTIDDVGKTVNTVTEWLKGGAGAGPGGVWAAGE